MNKIGKRLNGKNVWFGTTGLGKLLKVDKNPSETSVNPIANKTFTIYTKKNDDLTEILSQIANDTYEGRNLADVFDSEIASYSSPWQWMQDRVDMGFFTGLFPADHIPITMTDGEVVIEQIAGINPYKGTTDLNIGNHIDFISKDCLSQIVQWNAANSNNGTVEEKSPWADSNVYQYLNNTVYNKLPDDVKEAIVTKRALLETRYSSDGVLTDSTGWLWSNAGKLWIPTEYEVFGSVVRGTKMCSATQTVQYIIFANSYKNRLKRQGNAGNRCSWWLLTVRSESSSYCIIVRAEGYESEAGAAYSFGVPVCFRIAQQSA